MLQRFRNFSDVQKAAEDAALAAMIDRTQAMITFDTTGHILQANDNFLSVMGYELDEIVGQHHRMFCEPAFVRSAAYGELWDDLGAGQTVSGAFARRHKSGACVWIRATYAPILDGAGKVTKIIKLANDITPQRQALMQFQFAVEQIAEGQPGARIDLPADNPFHKVGQRFNAAIDGLQSRLTGLGQVAQTVVDQGTARHQRNLDLKDRAQQQVERLTDVSQASQSAIATLTQTEAALSQSRDILAQTEAASGQGLAVMEDARGATQDLETQARSMSEINQIIDDLSFQTSLLSLNAGIEAARAGDAGAGFAVVASEIRSLAHQSSAASAQISELITRSTATSSNAADSVSQAAVQIGEISESVAQLQAAFLPIVADLDAQIDATQKVGAAIETAQSNIVEDRQTVDDNLIAIAAQQEGLTKLSAQLRSVAATLAP